MDSRCSTKGRQPRRSAKGRAARPKEPSESDWTTRLAGDDEEDLVGSRGADSLAMVREDVSLHTVDEQRAT